MSVPYGAPQQQAGSPAPAGGFSLPSILALVGAGLGLIIYLLAFGESQLAPTFGIGGGTGTSVSLLLLAGLLAGVSLLPKGPQLHLLFAFLSVAGVLGLLQMVVHWPGDVSVLAIVALIVGLVEAGALVTAWLFNAEILKVTPKPAYPQGNWNPQAGQPGQYGQTPQGQFGQQAQYGQAEQQYAQQNPGTGGQPAQAAPYSQGTEVFGGTQQPGQYGQQPGTTPPPGGYGQ